MTIQFLSRAKAEIIGELVEAPAFADTANGTRFARIKIQTVEHFIAKGERRSRKEIHEITVFNKAGVELLTNFGKPWIHAVDGNYRNRGELLLRHEHNGVDLRLDQAKDTLANLQHLWGRPVHLQTVVDNKPALLSFDGAEHGIKTGGDLDDPRRQSSGKTR